MKGRLWSRFFFVLIFCRSFQFEFRSSGSDSTITALVLLIHTYAYNIYTEFISNKKCVNSTLILIHILHIVLVLLYHTDQILINCSILLVFHISYSVESNWVLLKNVLYKMSIDNLHWKETCKIQCIIRSS